MKIVANDIEQGFKELYFRHYPKAYKSAYYIVKDSQTAEDIVQEVFLKLWQKTNALSGVSHVAAFIQTMVRNAAFNFLKKHPIFQESIIELAYEEQYVEEDNTLKKAIEKAVSLLSPKCRLIFSLSRFEGLTNDEIAEHLNISKRTVETHISNALKMFRTDLKHFFEEYLTTFPWFIPLLFSYFNF